MKKDRAQKIIDKKAKQFNWKLKTIKRKGAEIRKAVERADNPNSNN